MIRVMMSLFCSLGECLTLVDSPLEEPHRMSRLRLFPQEKHHADLRNDYVEMRPMFFEPPPKFDDILEGLKVLEDEINRS